MASNILSTVLQLIIFTLIPFIAYLIRKKKTKGFFQDIGLKRSNKRANLLAMLIVILIALPVLGMTFLSDDFMHIMTTPTSMTGKFRMMGLSLETALLIVITAVFKTALAEEILFRGFLAKRLIAITNFQIGNTIHAIIFGVIHTLLFMTITNNFLFLFIIFFFPALGAYFKVYLNEKLANGSIIPGWIAHGLGNIISYSVISFGI